MTIKIKQSKTANTRTADHEVTPNQLRDSTQQHIYDVQQAMDWFCDLLTDAGNHHDWTKQEYHEWFYRDFVEGQKGKLPVGADSWYRTHVTIERHHLNDHVPDDVNLIDVLERIADICMAAASRSGKDKFYSDPLPPEVLQKAYDNTIKMLLDEIEVEQ